MPDRYGRILIFTGALLLAGVIIWGNRDFYHDDAYITLRYVQNYLAGNGFVWNPGEYVQGYTNFLHMLLIAGLGRLGCDPVWASQLIGMIAAICLVMLMYGWGRLLPGLSSSPFRILPIIATITAAPLWLWSLSGLESSLFTFLTTLGIGLLLIAFTVSAKLMLIAAGAGALALSFLVRPDGAVFIVIAFIWLLPPALKKDPSGLSNLVVFSTVSLLLITPYLIWQYSYYGTVLPNTLSAKTGVPLGLRLLSGSVYLLDYVQRPPFLAVALLAALLYLKKERLWSGELRYLALSVSAYLVFVLWAGGDHMPAFRLLLPVLPLMSLMLALALTRIPWLNKSSRAYVLMGIIVALSGLQLRDQYLHPQQRDEAAAGGRMVGRYIAHAWPPGSLIALNTAGSTPYYAAQHRFIDMLGLNDRHIARRKISKVTLPWQLVPGHSKGDGPYVLSRRPDYIIIGPAEGSSAAEPWFLSDLELFQDPTFHIDYTKRQLHLNAAGLEDPESDFVFTYYQRRYS